VDRHRGEIGQDLVKEAKPDTGEDIDFADQQLTMEGAATLATCFCTMFGSLRLAQAGLAGRLRSSFLSRGRRSTPSSGNRSTVCIEQLFVDGCGFLDESFPFSR
jgi:hypothetical protein